jgi:hypothetical protein
LFNQSENYSNKLDKLQYLTQVNKDKGLTSLSKRARAKFVQFEWVKSLIELNSPLQKKYIDTLKCSCSIKQEGEKFTSRYCNHRWCLICNRIRTAKLINLYSEPLDKLIDKQFVTLTRPNVPAEELKTEINYFYTWWRAMLRIAVKNGLNLSGVRKLEITFNEDRNDYHPHLHIIIEGKAAAEYIVYKWLKQNPTANPGAQCIKECYDYKELFKYVTKMTTPLEDSEGNVQEWFYPGPTDTIFQAIKGVRIYQPFGIMMKDKEEEDTTAEDIEVNQACTVESAEGNNVYKWKSDNWYNVETNEPLSLFEPDMDMYIDRRRICRWKFYGPT